MSTVKVLYKCITFIFTIYKTTKYEEIFHCINMSKQLVLRLYEPRSENIIPAYCKCFSFEIYKFISPKHYYEFIIGSSAWNCLLTFRLLMGPRSSSTFI